MPFIWLKILMREKENYMTEGMATGNRGSFSGRTSYLSVGLRRKQIFLDRPTPQKVFKQI